MIQGTLLRRTIIFLIAFVCLHVALNAMYSKHSATISWAFYIVFSAAAMGVCIRRALLSPRGARRSWILFSAGLFFWASATVLAGWKAFLGGVSPEVATISDFLFFFYGVPILLAISSPDENRSVKFFFWLDCVQVAVAGSLAYITIFSVAPFSGAQARPIPLTLLMWTYDIENLILAVAATTRLPASSRNTEERRFLSILTLFLWTYAILVSIYNHLSVAFTDAGMLDVLGEIPFAVLIVALLWFPARRRSLQPAAGKKALALYLDSARPGMFALVLLVLGAAVAYQHYWIGMAAIFLACGVYGLRSTVLQSHFVRSQQALEKAQDLLKEMALIDALTNVANRRSFDERLKVEWAHGARNRFPVSLLMVDVDYFKNLNDTFVHQTGDECLVQVAAALRSVLPRRTDFLARYGGEEFAAILSSTDSDGASIVAQRMQEVIESLRIPNPSTIGPHLTISIGAATFDRPLQGSPGTLVQAADRALYRAKQAGRNRIEFTVVLQDEEAISGS